MRTPHLRRGRQREEQDTEPGALGGRPGGTRRARKMSHKRRKSPKRRHSEGDVRVPPYSVDRRIESASLALAS